MTDLSVLSPNKTVPSIKLDQPTLRVGGTPLPRPTDKSKVSCHSPASISFVRSRMFYARAALNAKGRVTFGLRHIRERGNG